MKVELWTYECRRDGRRFESPARTPEEVFFYRSTGRGTLRLVRFDDPVVHELNAALARALGPPASEFEGGRRFGEALGAIADPDEDGSRWRNDAPPACPEDGGTDVRFVQSTEPLRFVDVAIRPLGFARWRSLDAAAQDALLRSLSL